MKTSPLQHNVILGFVMMAAKNVTHSAVPTAMSMNLELTAIRVAGVSEASAL